MIYNNSNDPIEIKKIFLRIWTLRDQIEAIIKNALPDHETRNMPLPELNDLISQYFTYPINEDFEIQENPEDNLLSADLQDGPGQEDPGPIDAQEEQLAQEMKENTEQKGNNAPLGSPLFSSYPDKEKISFGNTLLADINMERLAFFSQKSFLLGQSILIEFLVPNKFTLNAEVIYCKNFNMSSRIISTTRPRFRLIAKFKHLRPGEKTMLREFVSSIQSIPRDAQNKESESEDNVEGD